jgi:hypothetical protein
MAVVSARRVTCCAVWVIVRGGVAVVSSCKVVVSR